MLPYVCFIHWEKFCSGFIQAFFSFGGLKKWSLVALDRCLSYTVTVVWEFAGADSSIKCY